ncbi:hypothetical protein GCM10011579_095170 [Streptomyces albiflavescens]|uniref:Uncharacterized protein n=1 Tax=Streptomyces albiflavescens TaxID=1623582 RepID=A0A917YGG2_9ACTN|nr:hypothetical protein [Streptomyces albiflavescens]GGN95037.1 hypothetical protein GCM10011579_095170 [Streptomyces albiflavescens]
MATAKASRGDRGDAGVRELPTRTAVAEKSAKRTAVKKTVAKKTVAKKTVAKKTVAKKTVVKRATKRGV